MAYLGQKKSIKHANTVNNGVILLNWLQEVVSKEALCCNRGT